MRKALRLRSILGRSYNVDPADVLEAKKLLGQLGYYPASDGDLSPYPDEPLFQSIEAFQRDNELRVDGVMKPNGPTEQVLNDKLAGTEHTAAEEAFRPRRRGGGKGGREEKERGPGSEKDCDRLLAVDTTICNQVSKRKGAAAGERCHASASERYSACLRGRPMPPLNTGDW